MIPLVRSIVHALLWDPLAARRWIRGFLLWLGGSAVMVASVGWEVAQAWPFREWVGRLAIAGILGLGGMVTAGEKNPKPAAPAAPVPPPAAGFAVMPFLVLLATVLAVAVLVLAPALTRAADTVTLARDASGKIARSPAVLRAYLKAFPPPPWCVTAGKYDGRKCELDHKVPLCAGGKDAVENLVYQPQSHAAISDRWEADICRKLKACGVVR